MQDIKCKVPWCRGKANSSGKGYCRRHYDQIRAHGHILNTRTVYDLNEIEVCGDDAFIIIADKNGDEIERAIIDIEDVERVKDFRWTDNGNGYIRTFNRTTPVYLHRFIMDAPDGMDIDHINKNRLDNRKSNMRVVQHYINCHNRKNRHPFKVKDRKLKKPYLASITIKGKSIYLGYYKTAEEAERIMNEEKAKRGLII